MSLMHRRRAVVARQRYAGKMKPHPHEADYADKKKRVLERSAALADEIAAAGGAPAPAKRARRAPPKRTKGRGRK